MKIAFLVQGLFEISDSIGYDCVWQYKEAVRALGGAAEIEIFAERFVPERYPNVPIDGMPGFYAWCEANPDGIVVYHYCGAWSEIDDYLVRRRSHVVVRWHNNTPPWFYMDESQHNIAHTVLGFENIVKLFRHRHMHFWVNSIFTRDQLVALGGSAARASVVFPASRYLDGSGIAHRVTRQRRFADDGFNLLFVGRVVAHKGHRSSIATARRLQDITGMPVHLHFAGREDSVAVNFKQMAAALKVDATFHGEVSESALTKLYSDADIFICLSEHEGFGLPVFEAMRCGLPVIAWGCTSFRELLAEHPLCFLDYDLDGFAAAAAALQDEAARAEVMVVQERISNRYTHKIVSDQLMAAIRQLKDATVIASVLNLAPAALGANVELGAAIAGWLEKAARDKAGSMLPTGQTSVLHDSGANLFSLYDLKIFRNFFDTMKTQRFAAFEAVRGRAVLQLPATQFSYRFGAVENGILRLAEGEYPVNHLIYGPYIEFPKGSYEATIDFSVWTSVDTMFDIEINGQDFGRLGRVVVSSKSLVAGKTRKIRFNLKRDGVLVEFRLRPMTVFRGSLEFRGVSITSG